MKYHLTANRTNTFTMLTQCLIAAFLGIVAPPTLNSQVYLAQDGKVFFKSDAPLEVIEASSHKLKGAVDTEKNTFAFTVEMETFQGFNSPLQRTHFNENYMESNRFRTATFTGKIIEKIDFTQDGNYTVRAKGKLNIHGVERERIIKSDVRVKDGNIFLKSYFSVLLEEHDISIPKIVYQKIAEEILVDVEIDLKKKGDKVNVSSN